MREVARSFHRRCWLWIALWCGLGSFVDLPPAWAQRPDDHGEASGAAVEAANSLPLPPGSLFRLDKRAGGHSLTVSGVDFSPDGKLVATAGREGTVKLWSFFTGELVRTFSGHGGWVQSTRFSPDGRQLASASLDRKVRVWDVASGDLRYTLDGHRNGVERVVYSPDGKTLATASRDRKVRLFDAATGELKQALADHEGWVMDVVFSADSRTVSSVAGGSDRPIQFWQARDGARLPPWPRHGTPDDKILSLAYAPDDRVLASCGTDRQIHLWSLVSGRPVLSLVGHTSEVSAVAFSPDGRLLASAGFDHTIRVWEVDTGRQIHRFAGHTSWATSVAFAADGRHLISGSGDTTAIVWDLVLGMLSDEAEEVQPPPAPQECWTDLAHDDPSRAYRAAFHLLLNPTVAVELLAEKLHAQRAETDLHQLVQKLVAQLDHDEYSRREAATRALENLLRSVEPLLERALQEADSQEVRSRIRYLLSSQRQQTIQTADLLRVLRAIQVLERIGSPAAKGVLERLAAGAKFARQTQDAGFALQRLQRVLPVVEVAPEQPADEASTTDR